ncbi:polysaccharide pyruvyl transferase family protein [Sphingomonas crocodyli]|uniref:Exopolysaccharide biosynthesis protein n=1 Tax=Sphingomonas crocodyli TaxID=1979270 RepID=A0A437LXP7_9SPHN|nr:polysaccharide pyruvyl transferase family protein [Sphingomonas crocodyli]RVT90179.1 exopolysaccharide biosynthesis protein [Sphingomonas crocodyli]
MLSSDAERHALIQDLQLQIDRNIDSHLPDGRFALLDFPEHSNVGDSAIWLGEIEYFSQKLGRRPSYTCTYNTFSIDDLEKSVPDGPIFIHGGGNFGDIWEHHHKFREYLIATFKHRKLIQLPQSIQFWSDKRLDETARLIDAHPDFTLFVRDQASLDLANLKFNCSTSLTPDLAFYLGPLKGQPASSDILALMRTDSEAAFATIDRINGVRIEDWIDENINDVRLAKVIGIGKAAVTGRFNLNEAKLTAGANQRLRRGVRQLSSASVIITDRLHCHIIALLLGKQHAVLDNNYGKIGRFMDAFSGRTSLSYSARTFDDALEWARSRIGSNKEFVRD